LRLSSTILQLFSGNAIVTAATLFRDVVIAAVLGVTLQADSFFLVLSVPIFLLTVGAGAFRNVSVPALERARQSGDAQFQATGSALMRRGTYGVLVSVPLCGIIFAFGWISFAGDVLDPSAAEFARIAAMSMPMFACAAFVELSLGPAQACGQFLIPNLLRLGMPLGLATGMLLGDDSDPIKASLLSGFAGALIASILAGRLLQRHGMPITSTGESAASQLPSTVWQQYRALILATSIAYANPLVDQWMAKLAGIGAVAQLGYASRIVAGIAGIVAASVGPALLSRFSQQLTAGDSEKLRHLFILSSRSCIWAGCVAVAVIWLSAEFVVGLVYTRGDFRTTDAEAVASLIKVYAVQLPFYWASIAAYTYISAAAMNRFFVQLGLSLFVANLVLNLLLIGRLGVHGIAISTVLVYALSLAMMWRFLSASGAVRIGLRFLGSCAVPLLSLAGMLACLTLASSLLSTNPILSAALNVGSVGVLTIAAFITLHRELTPGALSRRD
jgi:putative peptidoglycan lipid II flippase